MYVSVSKAQYKSKGKRLSQVQVTACIYSECIVQIVLTLITKPANLDYVNHDRIPELISTKQ